MSESKQEIRKKINEILDNSELDLKKKALEIFHLTDKLSAQVGFEFLNVYSERFNESHTERMHSRDISRILSASFPFSVPAFLKFIGQDPQRLVDFTEASKKYMKSFPYSYMEVMSIYHLPGLAASYFYGNDESRSLFQNMNAEVTSHHYGTLMSAAIQTNRNEALFQIIESMPPNLLTAHVLFEIVDEKNYNWKVISSIIDKLNLNFDEKVRFKSFEQNFPLFLVNCFIYNGEHSCLELFQKINDEYGQKYSTKCIKEMIDFAASAAKADNYAIRNNSIKVIDALLEVSSLSPNEYTSIISLILNNKELKGQVDSTLINKVLNHKLLDSQYVDKISLITSVVNTVVENIGENKSYVHNARFFLERVVEKYPDEMKHIELFNRWRTSYSDFPKEYPKLNTWVKQDFLSRLEDYQKLWTSKDESGTAIFSCPQDMQNYANFLKENKFIVERKVESVTGGFFNKKTVVNTLLEWDNKAVQERNKEKKESWSFLTTDSGESMDLGLINTLPTKQLKAISESLVMMSYQFSNFSNDPLISISEESHFLKNNLPKMFNRIIGNYHEYKVFDEDAAMNSLVTQLLILQKKTTQSLTLIMKDIKEDVESEIKITEAVLRAPLTSKP